MYLIIHEPQSSLVKTVYEEIPETKQSDNVKLFHDELLPFGLMRLCWIYGFC
jgi:hypothetical protein